MTNTLEDGRIVHYSFTIDFAEQDPETYSLDELAAAEEDGDRETIKASSLATIPMQSIAPQSASRY
jgi:hypothetical protein